jgi:PAS domain S-box-containing protein
MDGDQIEMLDIRDQAAARRIEATRRIVLALNTNQPIEDIVLEMAKAMQELIPCDRLSLGILPWGRWYILEDGCFQSKTFDFPIAEDDTASGWVIHNRRPMLRRDIFKERRFKGDSSLVEEGVHSDLIVPLVVDGEVMGTFNFTSRAPNRYDESDLETAQSIADEVAVAVKQFQARLEIETIRAISEAVLKPMALDDILKMILTYIQSQGYDRVRLYLYDRERDVMVGAFQVGMGHESPFSTIVYPLNRDLYSKQRLASNRPWIYRTGRPEYEVVSRLNREAGIFSDATSPELEWAEILLKIVEGGREILIGQISLDNESSRRPLDQKRLDRLMVYASHAALAIRHTQLYYRMAEEVQHRTAELNEQNRQQEALLHINQAVQEMKRVSDLGQIVRVCYKHLRELGLDFQALAIHRLIDEETQTFESYEIQPSEKFNRLMMKRANIYRMWQGGQTVYRRDLEVDPGGMTAEALTAIHRRYGILPRCILDIPHTLGTVALVSVHPNAFAESEKAFLEQVARVLSMGLVRVADLEQVEASQKALAESQRFIRRIADATPMILYVFDIIEQRGVYINDEILRLGYTPEQFQDMGAAVMDMIHTDDYESMVEHIRELAAAKGRGILSISFRMRCANGEWCWLRSRNTVFTRNSDGSVKQILGAARDITDQMRAEEQVRDYQTQLRTLASELILAEERERRRIARDLHDGIGQTLLVSRMKLRGPRVSSSLPELARSMDEACEFIDQAIQSVRSLTFELSLPILYELEFGAAMEWLVEQIQEQHDVQIDLEDDGQPEKMDEEVTVLLFRTVRELLINVVKHAQAHSVRVSIQKNSSSIRIEVEDDGVGFDTSQIDFGRAPHKGGFGFFSIRERLNFLGGNFQVESEPGQGTRAVLTAPLKQDGHPRA